MKKIPICLTKQNAFQFTYWKIEIWSHLKQCCTLTVFCGEMVHFRIIPSQSYTRITIAFNLVMFRWIFDSRGEPFWRQSWLQVLTSFNCFFICGSYDLAHVSSNIMIRLKKHLLFAHSTPRGYGQRLIVTISVFPSNYVEPIMIFINFYHAQAFFQNLKHNHVW